MKPIAIIVLLVLVVGGGIYLYIHREATADRGVLVGYGFTEPFNGKSEVHIEFTEDMVKSDPPTGFPDGAVEWKPWALGHFEVLDSSNQPVTMSHVVTSPVGMEHRGSPSVGFATGEVTPGESYTLVYKPVASQPKRYSLKVTVPNTKTIGRQVYFVPPNAG
jgi:hypothetical protein